MSGRRGFSLLEVMVAMAILALSLTVIAGINANSFESSNYARGLTVATLLARSKMLDIELELQKDGFSQGERKLDGDFSDEGYRDMQWEAVVRPIDVDVFKLVQQMFGGELSPENLPDQMQAFLGASEGLDAGELPDTDVPADEVRQMLGGAQIELVMKQVSDTLADSIREIVLDVTWGPKDAKEGARFIQYVTTTGRIAAPTGRSGDRSAGTLVPPTLPDGSPNPASVPIPGGN